MIVKFEQCEKCGRFWHSGFIMWNNGDKRICTVCYSKLKTLKGDWHPEFIDYVGERFYDFDVDHKIDEKKMGADY